MMRLPRFRYHAPRSLAEAAQLLADHPSARLVAGGTDLLPNMKRGQDTPLDVVGLRLVSELRGITAHGQPAAFEIGALTTLQALERHADLASAWPVVGYTASLIASPPIRATATVGGNLCLDTRCNYYDQSFEWRQAIDFCLKKDGGTCWVAPGSDRCWAVSSSDLAPVLCAIGAEVSVTSVRGVRRVPLEALYADDGIRYLERAPDEILTAIHLPVAKGWRASYRKLRRRGAIDFPVLGVAVAVRVEQGHVAEARIFLGAVGSRPVRAAEAEQVLLTAGRLDDGEALAACAQKAARLAKPLDNTDFVMGWRKQMAPRLIREALAAL